MSKDRLHQLLALAAGLSAAGMLHTNSEYDRNRAKQQREASKALEKKQRVREQIRARRALKESK